MSRFLENESFEVVRQSGGSKRGASDQRAGQNHLGKLFLRTHNYEWTLLLK